MDVLFKGFHIDKDGKDEFAGKKGEWVKGYYIKAKIHSTKFGIHEDWIIESAIQNGGWLALCKKYPVLANSVSLFKEKQ